MTAGIAVAAFLALVFGGILAGGQLLVLLALVPAHREWTQEMSVRVHQDAMTWRPDRYMKPVGAGTMVMTVIFLVLAIIDGNHRGTDVLVAVALVCSILGTFMSTREWPINHEISSWEDHPDLERYSGLRKTWDAQHRVRTVFSLLAFLFLAAGAALWAVAR